MTTLRLSKEDLILGTTDWSDLLEPLGGPKSAHRELFFEPYEVVLRRAVIGGFGCAPPKPVLYVTGEPRPTIRFPGFETAVGQASRITALGEDWDGEGSSGYQIGTLERAISGAEGLLRTALLRFGRVLPAPEINPAHEGSIDLFWQLEDRDLLINIPAPADAPCSFFGEDIEGNTISGDAPILAKRIDLLAWLAGDV